MHARILGLRGDTRTCCLKERDVYNCGRELLELRRQDGCAEPKHRGPQRSEETRAKGSAQCGDEVVALKE